MQTCYRHTSRETGVSCANCGRPICPDCMTTTPVGMRCPECSKQRTQVRTLRNMPTRAEVTIALIAINAIAFLAELATGSGGLFGVAGTVYEHGALYGPAIRFNNDWWRLVTGGFLHTGIIHIGFNMYLLYVLGGLLEPAIGRLRFVLIYAVALLSGSLGALILSPNNPSVGASGAVFGLMGATFIAMRARGIDPMQSGIGGLILINLVLSFALANISIGAHIGGLVGGGIAALVIHAADKRRLPALGIITCLVLAAVVVVGSLAAADQSSFTG